MGRGIEHQSVLMARALCACIVVCVLALAPAGARAQLRTATVTGRVVTQEGEAAKGSEVRIVGLGVRVAADGQGRFVLREVPFGERVLEVSSERWGQAFRRVTVDGSSPPELVITVAPVYATEALTVSIGQEARGRTELYQATNVLAGRELRSRVTSSLGESLNREPGVNSTYHGPGSSRPVIRGLGGDRVRVLDNGLDVADLSDSGPDHAVSVEPLLAERIEIIRGPATLLYGGSAIGGAVNVIDNRIPTDLPARFFTGSVAGEASTVADEWNGSGRFEGALGAFAWHLEGLRRSTNDYRIPDSAAAEDPAEAGADPGLLENSALETTRFGAGVSYMRRRGYLGTSWAALDTEYGVPGEIELEGEELAVGVEPEAEEERVAVDSRHRRFDVEGALRLDEGFLREVRARLGVTDRRDQELEGDEVGTRKENHQWELRIEARHHKRGPARGTLGFQFGRRDFSALGVEAFVPPTETNRWGLFLYEEIDAGKRVRFQLGARVDRQDAESSTEGLDIDHTGFSASVEANIEVNNRVSLAFSASRSAKLPSVEALFSEGPHLAKGQFEIGDPGLLLEKGLSLDATVHARAGRVSGELSGFVNRFDDFIFLDITGEERLGLTLLRYGQEDALFAGFEAQATVELVRRPSVGRLALDLSSDYVWAELIDRDEPLPRIPPLRLRSGLRYDRGGWEARFGVQHVNAQNRVATFEGATKGYSMFDALVGYRILRRGVVHQLSIQGTNLTDQLARDHVSFIKDRAPLPGRNLQATYRLSF